MTRIALIGDVGGHSDAFAAMLRSVGVNTDHYTIPPDLTVIQVGDLVHKGPDSDGCVRIAAQLHTNNPQHYRQLVGNHEAHYLGGPDVTGREGVEPISDVSRATLLDWWRDGTLRVAAAITSPYGDALITHGGLTVGLHRAVGSPTSAADSVDALERQRSRPHQLFRPGALMTGVVDTSAGVIGPRVGPELYAPWWRRGTMPYTQIHGHEGVWWWRRNRWHDDVPTPVREAAHVDPHTRQSWLTVGQHRLWSVDPTFGVDRPDDIPAVTVLPGHVVA